MLLLLLLLLSKVFFSFFLIDDDCSGNFVVVLFVTWNVFNKGVTAVNPVFTVSTIAGIKQNGDGAEGSKATSAAIGQSVDIWHNPAGELFISDSTYNFVRKVSSDGTMSHFAGTGSSTSSGNDGKATSAGIRTYGICGDTVNSFMYFAEANNNLVRRLEVSSNIVTAFAGSGNDINDNGPATSANINGPIYCSVDTVGDVYITDKNNNLIRKVTISSGIITSVAGVYGYTAYYGEGLPVTSSALNSPQQIFLDSTATLYIYVRTHARVRKLDLTATDKTLVTVIGTICCRDLHGM